MSHKIFVDTVIQMLSKHACLCMLILLLLLCGCSPKGAEQSPSIKQIDFSSEILGKEMQLEVYTPKGYSEEVDYPVLYFFPDGGGSVKLVMNQYGIAEKAEKLIVEGEIEPLIIVAVDIDRSFGVNSSEKVETVETSTGKIFEKGMYEDYFINEIIPFIDSRYSTISLKQGRYIGGYSMGGFAALHIALRNPELFSKAGGHSPSIFVSEFPDKTVSDFLYPTESIRTERDPINIVQNQDTKELIIFLDVEIGGSEGVKYLYEVAADSGVEAEYHVLSLSHSRASCNQNMEQYLLFYAGISKDD